MADNEPSLRQARVAAYENDRPELRSLIPRSTTRILDLGCSSGAVGAALRRELGAEVVGIEIDPVYAASARTCLDRVIQADLASLAASKTLAAELGKFDCLLAGDVLEHLNDPWTVLKVFANLLSAGGHAVVGLPNARYWETFWQLGVRGTWPARSSGIFDRDHVRWFTAADGLALVRGAGLEPLSIHRQYRFRPTGSRYDHLASKFERTPLRPFLAFQIAIVANRP